MKSVLFCLIVFCFFAYAQDPRDQAKLEEGQAYEVAKSSLLKLGFKTQPSNANIEDPKPHSAHKEVTCGKHKNHLTGKSKSACSVMFQSDSAMINLEWRCCT
jgi:hypothetical protein